MDESSSPAQAPTPIASSPPDPSQYWCYHCDKRVPVEPATDMLDAICCTECKFGFVESIPAPPSSAELSPSPIFSQTEGTAVFADEPTLGSRFLQVLRLLAQVAREEGVPPPESQNPVDPPSDDDFLRIEVDGWENGNEQFEEELEEEEEDDDEDAHSVEILNENEENRMDNLEESEEDVRRRRRDVLRLRLRNFANRSRSEGRNRVLDWAEIFMGLEDSFMESRLEMPETDGYIGDPADYVDAAEYEALLQNLAETEGRRGAPPASKSAIAALKTLEIKSDDQSFDCAVCKDVIGVGSFAKELPCGHGYHGDCIVPWLGARNSCPVCRFELATDDLEYEEDKKKGAASASAEASSGRNHS